MSASAQGAASAAPRLRPDQIAALTRLQNRRTLYEIAVLTPDGRRGLVCYSDSTSHRSIRDAVWKRADELVAWLGAKPDSLTMEWSHVANGLKLSDGSIIRKTGRTKRDVIMEDSKLPYIGGAS